MKIVSRTGILLSLIFILITAYLERGLLDCPHELYRCTNILPAMPWYLFIESVLGSIILNLGILYLVGLYIDKGKLSANKKPRFITIFSFIINFAFGIIFIALGWFGSTFAPVPSSAELVLSQLMIPVGFVITIMSIFIFFTNKIKVYIALTAITLVSILSWMAIVSSYDMFWGLMVYVLVMTPLLILKLKTDGNQ